MAMRTPWSRMSRRSWLTDPPCRAGSTPGGYTVDMAQNDSNTVVDAPNSIRCTAVTASVGGQTIIPLPADASGELPSRGQVAVTGTADGEPFSTVVEPDGRRGHWIKVDSRLASLEGSGAGREVELELTAAEQWPEPDVPSDLRAAIDDAPQIAELWESITPMARWEWVRWIAATRNPDTRARRVEVGISKMESGKRRPCCFDLAACTDPDLSRSGKLMALD
ncbi:MAG: hypothetical protein JWM86_938 [Thermoleophilia bacterium]|nr:hypothetical protein [Thermoleophilia bacterium]